MGIKLNCLEKMIDRKTLILKDDFKVTMNSKEAGPNTLFFAINKGNLYAKEAENLGAFVIYDDKNISLENGYCVDSTVKFMQEFAKEYRLKKEFKVVGITGSNGKTTVKDILYSVLKAKGEKVYKTQGNYNNHIGLPFTILSANDDIEKLLLEMGMSDLGEIDLLASIAKPDYSIITNIGQSHLEFLKTMDNVFKAKTEIIKHTIKKVVVNGEDKYLKTLNNAHLVKFEDIKNNLYGKHNQLNVCLAKALLNDMGYENIDFSNIQLTSGRYQEVKGKYRYINDAYNASPISMKASIETFSSMFNDDYKIIALGDMLELGDDEIKYHEDLSEVLKDAKFDKLILHGPRMKHLYEKVKDVLNVSWFEDKEDIKKEIDKIETDKKKTILLKGSRSMAMEKIMEEV